MAKIKYFQALTRALREEMARDENVILLGEDVGPSGGIFAQTKGLYDTYGGQRVRDTPIAEECFVGAAVGAAMTGLRPVIEIGFEDFLTACMDPLVNQAAKLRYMLGGQVQVPLLLYTFGGGGLSAGPQHSQSLAAWLVHVPGLKVIMPSTPKDVLGLIKSGIRDDNPVICLLTKRLIGLSGEVPDEGEDFLEPLGRACIKRSGSDATVVAIGQMVSVALRAAETLFEEGIDIEVIDPMTLSPLDDNAIIDSVARTNHLLVVHEAHGPCGIGSEILARVCEEGVDYLRKPPRRLTPPFAPSPFAPTLEGNYLPDVNRLVMEVRDMCGRQTRSKHDEG